MYFLINVFRLVEQHHIERKALSDSECNNIVEYLTKRLEWGEDILKSTQNRYPALFQSTVIRVSIYSSTQNFSADFWPMT